MHTHTLIIVSTPNLTESPHKGEALANHVFQGFPMQLAMLALIRLTMTHHAPLITSQLLCAVKPQHFETPATKRIAGSAPNASSRLVIPTGC